MLPWLLGSPQGSLHSGTGRPEIRAREDGRPGVPRIGSVGRVQAFKPRRIGRAVDLGIGPCSLLCSEHHSSRLLGVPYRNLRRCRNGQAPAHGPRQVDPRVSPYSFLHSEDNRAHDSTPRARTNPHCKAVRASGLPVCSRVYLRCLVGRVRQAREPRSAV